VSTSLVLKHPGRLLGIHLLPPLAPPDRAAGDLTDDERDGRTKAAVENENSCYVPHSLARTRANDQYRSADQACQKRRGAPDGA